LSCSSWLLGITSNISWSTFFFLDTVEDMLMLFSGVP
jgi:hypothetical protein